LVLINYMCNFCFCCQLHSIHNLFILET
jgi:hypothetical protein